MKFEILKRFFDNESTIKLRCSQGISGSFITIHSIEDNKFVQFSYFDQSKSTEHFLATTSENEAVHIHRIIESSSDYFAQIVSSKNDELLVSFVVVNKTPIIEEFYIGVGDLGLGYEDFIEKFISDYTLVISDQRYYIFAKHIYSNENSFSIVNETNKYDVILSRREECGICSQEVANDQIWAIRKASVSYKMEDYVFQLRPFNLSFSDITSIKATTEQNLIEIQNMPDDGILSRWEKFAEQDYSISDMKVKDVGFIKFNNYVREGANIYTFIIATGFDEKLKKFDTYTKNSSSETILDIYEQTSERKKATIKFISLKNNQLKCEFDGNYIFKNEGYLSISNFGSETIYHRRLEAIRRIRTNQAAKKNILSLINGNPLHNKRNKKVYQAESFLREIKHAFKGKMPNKSQMDAIEVAINTPDFCIIQGPPGCGKTSLINAIDECLSKIDSSKHKYGASLSTAYQRESTKNMIASKLINGVPVPYITNHKDNKIYIESHFIPYINGIAEKLKNKYPHLVNTIGESTAANVLTYHLSKFKKETITLDELSYMLNDLINTTEESLLGSEINDLNDLIDEVNSALSSIIKPKSNEALYYIRMIPSTEASFDDDGLNTFIRAKVNLNIIDSELYDEHLNTLHSEFRENRPDFEIVKKIKNDLIFLTKNITQTNRNIIINEKAYNLLERIKTRLDDKSIRDNDQLLIEYIDSFVNNPLRVRQALESWITSVAATHQISGDIKAIPQTDKDAKHVEYDNVLIDEAARSCPPDLLIPITCAKNRIIMVGDHKQLPQFVNDEVLNKVDVDEVIKNQMKDVSMFEYLISTTKKLEKNDHLNRFITLNEQYRMPKVLGDFISNSFYPEIGIKSPLGNPNNNEIFNQTLPHISGKCMIWCDVPHGIETKEGKGYSNEDEARVIAKLVSDFLYDEANQNLDIGVITFYRDQVHEIKNQLLKFNVFILDENKIKCNSKFEERIKIDTVDAFQGLECDIVILSMVRSNPFSKFEQRSFGFLKDERRLCVALSRQKRCLIVVGNGSGMLNTDVSRSSVRALSNYYDMCKNGGDYIDYIESKAII